MKRAAVWLPEAVADLQHAQDWYRGFSPELGHRFALAVAAAVDAVVENPRRFPVIHRQCRRAGVRRFPYGLIFEIEVERVVIVACFHGSRDPRRWQRR